MLFDPMEEKHWKACLVSEKGAGFSFFGSCTFQAHLLETRFLVRRIQQNPVRTLRSPSHSFLTRKNLREIASLFGRVFATGLSIPMNHRWYVCVACSVNTEQPTPTQGWKAAPDHPTDESGDELAPVTEWGKMLEHDWGRGDEQLLYCFHRNASGTLM